MFVVCVLLQGMYEAKQDGFLPGGASLHMCMTPHGPDTTTFEAASRGADAPSHIGRDTLAFMFETYVTPRVTPAALGAPNIDRDYYKCWLGLKSHFTHPELPVCGSAAGTSAALAGQGVKSRDAAAVLQPAGEADTAQGATNGADAAVGYGGGA